MNLWIGLLAIAIAYFLEWHGYSEGKRKGFEQGYCRGRTDANLWWIKMEEQVDQARQTIWKENT
jgi:flagellar biosynthesis/type III secretory pathway protein FliH